MGMLSWIVAARALTPAELGTATAFVSAFLLISGCTELNLGIGLLRWLPRAGGAAGTLLLRAGAAVAVLAGVVAVLALYRGMSMIHEISHIKHAAVPGFRAGWNALIGVPMMIPSFMYEGVHNLHHAKTRYGTSEDPEYLPLALMKPWTLPVFLVAAMLAPLALLFRFGVLGPLSLLVPPLRKRVARRLAWASAGVSAAAVLVLVLLAT